MSTMTATTMLSPQDHTMDTEIPTTPTTPRAVQPNANKPQDPLPAEHNPSINAGGIDGQKPLPTSPFPGSTPPTRLDEGLHRGDSQRSVLSSGADSMDIDGSEDESEGSGDDTEGESGKMSKKKKGQRFFCTDFPPCNLSFTRSEHLARHIRKHTGERPFQCHCNRRFSRLDNLRQHAQTVHVNEDIPGDSLAATGTRFQRQIRTDRVRPPGSRARAGTGGSQGSHSRGHSRNLSASSIGSTSSNYSVVPEPRRRPPPLIMASEATARNRVSVESSSPPTTPTSQYRNYSAESPGGFSTPTSTAFSTGPGSPNFGSNYASPVRNAGFFGGPPPARRLSVPSTANPFSSPHGHTHPPPFMSPNAPSSSSYSNNSSVFASPTSSNFSFARADPHLTADAEWRRRTWHPTTYSGNVTSYGRPATSGLSYSQTPDAPQPAFAPNATAAAGPTPRLPGIESFDQVQHRPSTPPRRQPSPMHVDPAPAQPGFAAPSNLRSYPTGPDHRRGHVSWDLSLHSNLTRLDLQGGPPKDAAQWGQQTINEIHQAASRPVSVGQPVAAPFGQTSHLRPQSPATPQRNKRHGWYNGPPAGSTQTALFARTSPEDSSSSEGVPTPGTSAAEYHPAIRHSSGYIEHHNPANVVDASGVPCAPVPPSQAGYAAPHHNQPTRAGYYDATPRPGHDLGRLEALVAVATSEENTATTAR